GTLAAAISEAEIHQPSVIVARCGPDHSGLPTLDELAAELHATADLRQTPLVVIAPPAPPPSHLSDLTVLGETASVDDIVDAVRAVLPAITAIGQRNGRVLVAEDDGDMAAWLRTVLMRGGFEVTLVRDGLAAIVRAIEILPDAVILDVNMPKMGADEALRHLLGNPSTRDIPIIVISGTVPDSRPHFIEAGAVDFFAKPFNGDLLVRRLIQLGRSTPHG
ncbi:MAG: response regulator, partial [Vicinamibacterales bacterium]